MVASAERVAVAWAKTNTAIAAIVGTRVATKLPADPTFPFLRATLTGGTTDGSDAPIWVPLVTFDCYADDRAGADDLSRTVIDQLEAGTHATSQGTFYGRVLAVRPTPEPDTGWERFTVDALFILKPVS